MSLYATAMQAGHAEVELAYLLRVVPVHLHQLGDIKPGSTQDLDLPYVHALQRVDATALLLNVLACTHPDHRLELGLRP